MGAAGATNTQALAFGGDTPPRTAKTESWDGSSWTEVNDLSTAVDQQAGVGTYTVALSFGGATPSLTAATEEWTFPPPTAAILTEGDVFLSGGTTLKGFGKLGGAPSTSWSSGGTMNTGRAGLANGSTGSSSSASLAFGGNPYRTANELYEGTSWTESADLNTGTQGHG